MTPLRQRMLDEMQIRYFAKTTQVVYINAVAAFARHYWKSPSELGPEQIHCYLVYLTNHASKSSSRTANAALRFFYRHVMDKEWKISDCNGFRGGQFGTA
jgi:integrase/recombinase XerD